MRKSIHNYGANEFKLLPATKIFNYFLLFYAGWIFSSSSSKKKKKIIVVIIVIAEKKLPCPLFAGFCMGYGGMSIDRP